MSYTIMESTRMIWLGDQDVQRPKRSKDCAGQSLTIYLFVHFGSALDLSNYHAHNGATVSCGQRKKLLVAGDVLIP